MPATYTHNNWYPSQERELEALRKEGLSTREIARRMGRTHGAIRAQIAKYPGMYPKRTRFEAWYEVLQCTHTIEGAARIMKVRPSSVHRIKYILRKRGYEVAPAKREVKA